MSDIASKDSLMVWHAKHHCRQAMVYSWFMGHSQSIKKTQTNNDPKEKVGAGTITSFWNFS